MSAITRAAIDQASRRRDRGYRAFLVAQSVVAVGQVVLAGVALGTGERALLAWHLAWLSGMAAIWWWGHTRHRHDQRAEAQARVDLAAAEAQRDLLQLVLRDVTAGKASLELHGGLRIDPRQVN